MNAWNYYDVLTFPAHQNIILPLLLILSEDKSFRPVIKTLFNKSYSCNKTT